MLLSTFPVVDSGRYTLTGVMEKRRTLRFASLGRTTETEATRVQDCYIWAEIHYLDSATDYREYLPSPRDHSQDDFTTLDSGKNVRPQRRSRTWPDWTIPVLFLVVGLLLYLVAYS